jgi:hypothetical protein
VRPPDFSLEDDLPSLGDSLGPLPSLDPSVDSLLQRAAKTSLLSYPGYFSGSERYELVRRLGRGGFGVVFEAIDHAQGGRVALKVLRPNRADQLYRFKREFRSLSELIHPNLVRLYELVARDQDVFFTMERIEGVTFLDHVASSPERARAALRQLAAGLNALHRSGVLHRDVKPSNVMVDTDGRVVLLDFGLAVELTAGSDTAELVGTPLYMSPEQCAQEALGAASDWYAVGVMLYEALTGKPPFSGTVMDIIARKQGAPPPPPSSVVPSLPRDLDELCRDLLQREPERRPSGEEVLQRLAGDSGPLQLPAREELFVGRQAERASLRAAFEQSTQRRRTVTMMRGPSGIGKSTLLRRFLEDVKKARPDAVILAGRCYERESVPYKALDAVVDELARHLRRLSDVDCALVMPREAAALMQLFPVFAEVPSFQRSPTAGEINSAEIKSRGAAALRELLSRLADRRPVVACVDDLQWGDVDSAMLLAELVRAPDPPAVCFIISFREDEVTTSPLLQRLAQLRLSTLRELPVTELRLGSLGDAEAEALAAALLAESSGDAGRAAAIVRESGGNPFFLAELTRSAGEGELGLSELVQRRVARLDEPARRLLEVVAVAGRPVESQLAASAAGLGSGLRDALATLRAEHLLRAREVGADKLIESYHDRIRVAVAASLEPARLEGIHLALANALERREDVDAAQLALHLVDGGAPERALVHLVRAAEKAAAALAFDEAARLYRQALALKAGDLELTLSLSEALSSAGHGVVAARLFLEVASRIDEARSIDLQRRAAEELLMSGQLDEGYAALSGVLSAVGLSAPRSRTGAVTRIVLGRVRRALRGIDFTERDPTSLSDRERLRVDTVCGLAMSLTLTDPLIGAALQADHLRLALRTGDRARVAVAVCVEAVVNAVRGVPAQRETRRLLDRARELAGLGRGDLEIAIALIEGGCAVQEGRWLDGWKHLGDAERQFSESPLGHSAYRTIAQYLRMTTLFWMGRSGLAATHLPSLMREMEQRGHLLGWTWLKIVELWMLLCSGRIEEAEGCGAAARERLSATGFQLQRWYLEFGGIFISLFQRDGEGAWRRACGSWPFLRLGFASQLQRVAARWVRANAALARAVVSPQHQRAMLSEARKLARKLRGEQAPWAEALTRSLQASIASVAGDDAAALRLLGEAEPLLEECHLESVLAAVRYYRGRVIGGDAGGELAARAETWMAQQHVVVNALWGQLPGRWPD